MQISARRKLDKPLHYFIGISALIGGFLVLDAGYPQAMLRGEGPLSSEWKRHILWLLLGTVLYLLVAHMRISTLRMISRPLFYLLFIGCLLVFVPGVGLALRGANRWIDVGWFSVQPSEFLKPAIILYLGYVFTSSVARYGSRPRNWPEWMDFRFVPFVQRLWPFILVLLVLILIERQPDMGTAILVGAAAFGAVFFSQVRMRIIFLFLGILVVLGVVVLTFEGYRIERLFQHSSRWDPGVVDSIGYQPSHSELAMAVGGAAGVGPAQGRAKHVLPAATTDFVYTTIVEELGLVGALTVIVLLGGISLRLIYLAGKSQDLFCRIVIGGTGWWLGVQSTLNMLMAGALVAPVGVPLPLFSYGGSNILALALGLGFAQAALAGSKSESHITLEESRENSRYRRRYRRTRLSRA